MVKQAVSDDSLIGKTLGHYCIAEKIGAGAMGEVYRARDEHLDREVAIKVLPSGILSDESSRRRFRKEALALSKLNHPNIATIHDFDTQQGVDFLVMEYIPGYVYFPCSSPDECIQGKMFMRPCPFSRTMRSSTYSSNTFAQLWKKWESNQKMLRKSRNAWKVSEELQLDMEIETTTRDVYRSSQKR